MTGDIFLFFSQSTKICEFMLFLMNNFKLGVIISFEKTKSLKNKKLVILANFLPKMSTFHRTRVFLSYFGTLHFNCLLAKMGTK